MNNISTNTCDYMIKQDKIYTVQDNKQAISTISQLQHAYKLKYSFRTTLEHRLLLGIHGKEEILT